MAPTTIRFASPVGRGRRDRLTPLSGASYHPPDDDAPVPCGAPARLRAFRGDGATVPEAGWRGSRTVPMKQTYQPKKRHRAKEHGFRARMRTASGPPRPRRSAGSRSKATDGLTLERGPNPPRLVMLSRPQDFAALQGPGPPGPIPSSPPGSCGPTSRRRGSACRPAASWAARWSATASAAGSARCSG